jgi:hypothetical protein
MVRPVCLRIAVWSNKGGGEGRAGCAAACEHPSTLEGSLERLGRGRRTKQLRCTMEARVSRNTQKKKLSQQ